jgi:hypothetical protein
VIVAGQHFSHLHNQHGNQNQFRCLFDGAMFAKLRRGLFMKLILNTDKSQCE